MRKFPPKYSGWVALEIKLYLIAIQWYNFNKNKGWIGRGESRRLPHRHEVTEFIIFVFQKSLKKSSNIFYVIYSDKSITRKLEMVLQSLQESDSFVAHISLLRIIFYWKILGAINDFIIIINIRNFIPQKLLCGPRIYLSLLCLRTFSQATRSKTVIVI